MSAARRRAKHAARLLAHQQTHPGSCSRCGRPGQHFAPPGLGSPGAWMCATFADLHTALAVEGTDQQ